MFICGHVFVCASLYLLIYLYICLHVREQLNVHIIHMSLRLQDLIVPGLQAQKPLSMRSLRHFDSQGLYLRMYQLLHFNKHPKPGMLLKGARSGPPAALSWPHPRGSEVSASRPSSTSTRLFLYQGLVFPVVFCCGLMRFRARELVENESGRLGISGCSWGMSWSLHSLPKRSTWTG